MALILPQEDANTFELTPAGTHVATCYRIIDLGTQKIEWQGVVKFHHQIIIGWELTDEKMADGKPFAMQKFYNFSSNEAARLRIDLESWRGQPFSKEEFGKFDIARLLGKSCLMGIVHENKNGKIKAVMSSILKLPKGMTASPLVNPVVQFDLGSFNQEVYDGLSDFCKQKIALSPEYAEIKNPTETMPQNEVLIPSDLNDDLSDVPF